MEQICLVCSPALEAFRAALRLSSPIQHAKSEEVGCRMSESLNYSDWLCASSMTILIGGVLVNQQCVRGGRSDAGKQAAC